VVTSSRIAREAAFVTTYDNGYGKPYGKPLREWLRSLGILGQRDNVKRVPGWVFEAGSVGAREFLAGYLATDGCVKVRPTERGGWIIHFDTVSLGLAEDVQALMLRIGVVSSIGKGGDTTKSAQPIYRLMVSSKVENLRLFASQVSVRGKKAQLLQAILDTSDGEQTNPGLFGLPPEVSADLAISAFGAHQSWRHQGKRMRRDTCLEWATRLNDGNLRDWAMSDLLWEDVLSIVPVGEAEVFDIRVPDCANFLANGIIAHNSGAIEQDADIVMFIYRDEVYNPDTDRKNIADIIVAKHRNGPVGQVSLFFQAAQTRYRDLELRTPDF
jgi:replicative DNA helicase